jgi:hypothetical protein
MRTQNQVATTEQDAMGFAPLSPCLPACSCVIARSVSDEAIQGYGSDFGLLRFARNDGVEMVAQMADIRSSLHPRVGVD